MACFFAIRKLLDQFLWFTGFFTEITLVQEIFWWSYCIYWRGKEKFYTHTIFWEWWTVTLNLQKNRQTISLHFGLYKESKLRGTQRKSLCIQHAVKSSQLIWTGQYKKCVQYNFKFPPVYSDTESITISGTHYVQVHKCPEWI